MAVMALVVSGRGRGDIPDAGARGAHGAHGGAAAPSRCPLGAVPPWRRCRAERHQLLRGIEPKGIKRDPLRDLKGDLKEGL